MKNNKLSLKNISVLLISIFLLWYLLPAIRFYLNGFIANVIMTVVLITWSIIVIIIIYNQKKVFYHKYLLFVVINIMFYICSLFFSNTGNISEFIKMGVIYWFPTFVFFFYYSIGEKKAINYLFKLCFFCIIVTIIPTIIELIRDSSSLRWMAYYAGQQLQEQTIKSKYNIGDFSFIYSLIFCIPILYYYIKKNKNKKICIFLLILVILTILKASFSIAIILSLISLIMCFKNITLEKSKILSMIFLYIIFLGLSLLVLFPNILVSFAKTINNNFISDRIIEIANALKNTSELEGDLSSRAELYMMSIKTFKNHPIIGIGGYYYVENVGIGYHSQILDDLARYGIFYFVNTLLFIIFYKKFLSEILAINVKLKKIINIELIIYLLLLFVNPIYLCSWISMAIFILLPCMIYKERVELNEDTKQNNI